MKKTIFLILAIVLLSCNPKTEPITFPFSQHTVGISFNKNINWKYDTSFIHNQSFISPPAKDENWDVWYKKLKDYQRYALKNIGNNSRIFIEIKLSGKRHTDFHFDRIAWHMNLKPSEKIIIRGKIHSTGGNEKILFGFNYKSLQEPDGYVIRKTDLRRDSLLINQKNELSTFTKELTIPSFATDSFCIAPFCRIERTDTSGTTTLMLRDVKITVPFTNDRDSIFQDVLSVIKGQEKLDKQLYERPELKWMKKNFVMGFAFIWDEHFWNPEKSEYTVQEYCDEMKREFGGIQSVLLWHSYPNIGIDEKNQFDYFMNMPGGTDGLKKVTDAFHKNNVRVFVTYNPWDLDTRRNAGSDEECMADIVGKCDIDGVFMDTWTRAGRFQKALDKYKRGVAIVPEVFPDFTKDIHGYYSCVGSWAQNIFPYNNQGVSHLKWLIPEHKQYFINRGTRNRHSQLALAWINGQGIMLWENLFGTQNFWNARDRAILRRMNPIWQKFFELYASYNWKPYVPVNHEKVHASLWFNENNRLWNIVSDIDDVVKNVAVGVDQPAWRYYDLWNGNEIKVTEKNGQYSVGAPIECFGCILGIKEPTPEILALLDNQRKEALMKLMAVDEYGSLLPLKDAKTRVCSNQQHTVTPMKMLAMPASYYHLECKHGWREGGCYPEKDAKNDQDLNVINGKVNHVFKEKINAYSIMPRVVTNDQFEAFIKASGYSPRCTNNFLKHWKGATCPDSMKSKPVVYVSLEDARAYSKWAGLCLPTEWEWQAAAEKYGEKFITNEVWEWNESERNDGYNRFVNLRGGCSALKMHSSWWYFSGNYGGPQKTDSHCKYFLMYPGLDRSSTIGFRCVLLK